MSDKKHLILHDVILIGIMAVLAGCGLIYEYLLSHYAGRVLGAVETAIYAMIGIMIVSMGLGAFAARWFKQPFNAFAWLEAIIALMGMTSILVIAGLIAITGTIPQLLTSIFNLPIGTVLNGQLFIELQQLARYTPYLAGFMLGFFIGMEIPLIARIRQQVHGIHLENNAGTIYGADYIGAGVGAAVWVIFFLAMDITTAAILTALFNVLVGLLFLYRYHSHIRWPRLLLGFHLLLLAGVMVIGQFGQLWMQDLTSVLYKDKVIYAGQSNYQHITVTERWISVDKKPIVDLYINGRLQFSSNDEYIYHSMLVYPAMAASARHDKVLVIGGGDGLALRNILKWNPQSVTLIDLDPFLVGLFSDPASHADSGLAAPQATLVEEKHTKIQQFMTELNDHAFADPRVQLIFGDAFIEIDRLLSNNVHFDTIIVDLPDPNHPDLNKLYSDYFYAKLAQLLQADGALVIQSTSPYHAKRAFQSIGKTVKYAGFKHVEQYRQNIPSFGEWGWTIATKSGQSALERIKSQPNLTVDDDWVSHQLLLSAFVFPKNYFSNINEIEVNRLGSTVLYRYHYQAWQTEQGLYSKHQP